MRAHLLFPFILLGTVSFVFSQASSVGPLPDERKAVSVEENERNPFGRRAIQAPTVMPSDAESEESLIRSHVSRIGVRGFRSAPEGNKALLGTYLISTGMEVSPFFPNQKESLRVNSITPTQVELGFVEKDGTHASRLITVAFDLSPAVRYKLTPASAQSDSAATSEFGGVIRKK